jgi:hypothetical protein
MRAIGTGVVATPCGLHIVGGDGGLRQALSALDPFVGLSV